jgi:hypothetical protein
VDTIPLDPARDQFLLLLSDGMYTLLTDDRLVQTTFHYLVDHDDDPDLVAKHVLEQGIREDRGPAGTPHRVSRPTSGASYSRPDVSTACAPPSAGGSWMMPP